MPESSKRTPHTTRLYHDDATLEQFSATVTALAHEGRVVYLDRSAFYPTSGGQPHDLGWLADMPVVDVVDEGAVIAHHLAAPLELAAGAMVTGRIDMTRRVDHMQQHTGQHLLSAVLADHYGWPTASVHFGDLSSTVDVMVEHGAAVGHSANTLADDPGAGGGSDASPVPLAEIEARVNALALSNAPVTVSYEASATASGLRKASAREGDLRIVTIEGLDRSACGGTHVSRTAEIGAILLRRAEKTRGQVRIEFLCGRRAVARARADAELLTRAARPLSASPQDVPQLVEQMQRRLLDLERANKALALDLAAHHAAALWKGARIDSHGVRRVHIAGKGAVRDQEPLAQQLIALGGCVVLVTSTDSGGVLLASATDTTCDAGQALRAALQAVGGRGGGSLRLAQGTVGGTSEEQRREAVNTVARALGF